MIKAQATVLANLYKNDINENELILEVESFKYHALILDPKIKEASAADIFNFIYENSLQDAYPNISTALKIFLTMPVTVASNERSFSKLKLIKTYLRNGMSQQRLTNLSIICIEKKLASQLCYDDIIKEFAAKKAKKIKL